MESKLPILVIGQGIAGTLLSFELFRNHIPFLVIDTTDETVASYRSGAVLNPYSGKTAKGTERRKHLYEHATAVYRALEDLLQISIIKHRPLLRFEENSAPETTPDLALQSLLETTFNLSKTEFSLWEEVYSIDNVLLLKAWRRFLSERALIKEEYFDAEQLTLHPENIEYKNAPFQSIVYCNGLQAMEQELFAQLRFTINRGDSLILDIPSLQQDYIYQKESLRILPKNDGTFWLGSNYIWDYENMVPNVAWREQALNTLQQWLNVPFTVLAHHASKRPTTAGQIPFVGWHPIQGRIGICNGFGTKGFSVGPTWVYDFVHQSILKKEKAPYQYVLDQWLKG